MSSHLKVVQKRACIGRPWTQRLVLEGLGLGRPGRTVIVENVRAMRGMIRKVLHLVEVTEVQGGSES